MKKTYIQPTTVIVKTMSHSIIAASPTGSKVYDEGLSGSEYGLAREDNAWDIWGNNADDFEE